MSDPQPLTDREVVKQKVESIVRDIETRVMDQIGMSVPERDWEHVPAVLRDIGYDEWAEMWEDGDG